MESTPKISVIIPNYNYGKFLKATIESCLNQTLPPIEILVCDDGSNDNSSQIVEGFKDKRVKWLPGKHTGGPGAPRNRGIKASKGEWLAFLDSDDVWMPTKLEKQIKLMQKLDLKASATEGLFKIHGKVTENKASNWKEPTISFLTLMKNNYIICSSAVIHKSILPVVEGFVEDIFFKSFNDYNFWLRVSTQTNFAFVNENLVIYRDEPKISLRKDDFASELVYQAVRKDFFDWAKRKSKMCPSLTENANVMKNFAEKISHSYLSTIKRIIGKTEEKIISTMLLTPLLNLKAIYKTTTFTNTNKNIELVSIAFNNLPVLEKQIKFLKRYLADKFYLTVADNSSNLVISRRIALLCLQNKVRYLRIPSSFLKITSASFSHGLALNWVYEFYLKNKKIKYFGFLDHDIFPIRKTSLVKHLENRDFWGLVQEREDKWYLWAGFCFFKKSVFDKVKPNFLPVYDLDTGGGNWKKLYSKYNKQNIQSGSHYYSDKITNKKVKSDSIKIKMLLSKNQLLEVIGDWVHTFNGSNWRQ